MLLHYTVDKNPPLEVVKILFQLGPDTTNKFMGELAHSAPPAVTMILLWSISKGSGGWKIFCEACHYKKTIYMKLPISAIWNIPSLCDGTDDSGNLPLHVTSYTSPYVIRIELWSYIYLLIANSTIESLVLLFSAWSRNNLSARQRWQIDLQTKFELQESEDFELIGDEKLYLLHRWGNGRLSSHLVKLLLQAFQRNCLKMDDEGMLPMHHTYKQHRKHNHSSQPEWSTISTVVLHGINNKNEFLNHLIAASKFCFQNLSAFW